MRVSQKRMGWQATQFFQISSTFKMPKKKPTIISKEYKIENLERFDPAEIARFADKPEGKDSPFFATPDGLGVTIGRSLEDGEYEGKELPEWKNDRQLFVELNINFVVRVTCDREGTTYLEIHQAGHQSFYSFHFKGIEYRELFSIVPDFEQRLSRFLIRLGIYPLFWALYREKESDKAKRSDAYEAIADYFEIFFKKILKPKPERKSEPREILPGFTIRTIEERDGRPDKTEAELEQEKSKFISDVFKALKRIESEGGKRTQLDVGLIVFEDRNSEDVQSLMKNKCRLFGLKWNEILSEYDPKKV